MIFPARLRFLVRFVLPLLILVAPLALAQETATKQNPWESKNRDAWQRPADVMDALGVKPGSVVADVGCGKGYFTFRLAERVGPEGKVYAVDIKEEYIADIRREAGAKGLTQIEAVVGDPDTPHLPAGALDAILVVDAYHEMRDYDAMMTGFYQALKPGGMLGIIDWEAEPGKPRSEYSLHHRMPANIVREDADRNHFHFLREEPGMAVPGGEKRRLYFLLFEKPKG